MNKEYFKDMSYKEISRKLVYNGKRIEVEEIEYLNGNKKVYREHVDAGDAIVILPITDSNEVILVQETRTPIGKLVLTIPAGMIEEGEKPEEAARRELEEETGFWAEDIEFLREYHSSIGYTNEKLSIYLATNLKETKQNLDEDEEINVIKLPLDEVINLLNKNQFTDASTIIALMHYIIYKRK